MRRRNGDQPVSDINITPLTDVMMVLLVIFMISSPVLLARGMEVHLPQVAEPQALVEQDHVLFVTSGFQLVLDGTPYSVEDLAVAFQDLVATADETGDVINLFLRADESVTYRNITLVMDMATQAGIERISLVQDVVETPAGANGIEPNEGDVTDTENMTGDEETGVPDETEQPSGE